MRSTKFKCIQCFWNENNWKDENHWYEGDECVSTYGKRTNVVHTMSSWLMEWIYWFSIRLSTYFLTEIVSICAFTQSKFGIISNTNIHYPMHTINCNNIVHSSIFRVCMPKSCWIRMSSFRILIKLSGQIETIIPNSKIIPTHFSSPVLSTTNLQIAQIHTQNIEHSVTKNMFGSKCFWKRASGT